MLKLALLGLKTTVQGKTRFRHKMFCCLFEKKKLCDVTLASTDGYKFQAQKVILLAHSYVLKNM